MPAMQMSRGERFSLEKIVKRPCLSTDIPSDHAEKLLNYGLVKRQVMLLHATPLGQLAILGNGSGETISARPPPCKEQDRTIYLRRCKTSLVGSPLRL